MQKERTALLPLSIELTGLYPERARCVWHKKQTSI